MPTTFDHWAKIVRDNKPRMAEAIEGFQKGTLAVAESISTSTEEVNVSGFGVGKATRVTHPYMGVRSWIRVMPEPGTAAVVAVRGDTAEPEISYYWSGLPWNKVKEYLAGQGHYRPLNIGEIEVSSYGLSQAYFSRRGNLRLRGGVTTIWASNDELETGSKAPTHRRLLHDHSHNDIVSEERYGVMWRKGDDHTKRIYPKKNSSFAKEYIRSLTYSGVPYILFQHQEGHVFNSAGEEVTSPAGYGLRLYKRWWDSSNSVISHMVDENSNVWWILTDKATVGWTTKIPKGTFRLEAGDKIQLGAQKDVEITGENMIYKARGTLYIQGDKAIVLQSYGAIQLSSANVQINSRVVLPGENPI